MFNNNKITELETQVENLEGANDAMGQENAALNVRINELEEIIRANLKIRDGIQGNVDGAKNDLIQLIWSLESVQTGVELGEVDWLYIMRDINRAIFKAQCIDALLGDIQGVE